MKSGKGRRRRNRRSTGRGRPASAKRPKLSALRKTWKNKKPSRNATLSRTRVILKARRKLPTPMPLPIKRDIFS
jgi:hypothetical protein